MLERIYSRIGYMGKKGEFEECTRSNQRIRERVSMGYGRCGATRAQKRDVPTRRTTREVYGEEVVQMVRQAIRPGILGKDGKELETMEGQEASKERGNEDDPGRRRNGGRKIRSSRIDGER